MKVPENKRHGAISALLDEYERSLRHLKAAIETIPADALSKIIDAATNDDNCRSVQTILSHVVNSGYGYATSIHNSGGNHLARPAKVFHETIEPYLQDIDSMFAFTENVFQNICDNDLEQLDDRFKIKTGWGQLYDIEQLMEHAIVHILRHRRQIEKIKWDKL
ncbi:MAG: DinB family protein [Chitinophagaceae bacterium]